MEKDIGKIQKNDQSDIVLRIDDFGGKRGFTVREFVTSDRYTGFTKAGVRILAKDFPKFKEMVNSVSEEEMQAEPEISEEPKETKEKPAKKAPKSQEELPDY
ncbi:hypothetical protein GW931_00655 [archaeon]|nr:hypothetical protein [archaeon]PJC45181.1 MAG: hypothetical protein CO037_02825 [Candidatus Pacearchaeota archaeon CG_4_9_14_0_2_um_filter_30_8]